ncbi:hypothetical protein HXX76_011865 [Chlamydomonas incerta]|uniref:Uncharacterized protein n=1 Tax=Chlamydomonas incerta TaxID=51695 RepID=A0A835VUC8_CHLIN|nr:hypothetical protein HXX76_011865 [Chlamydomonas incerta]|eukprot:KAG2428185.1 hypothetical protein HXX76_011865 [Chlamydomonas incerta]
MDSGAGGRQDENAGLLSELREVLAELKKANKKDANPVPTGITPRGLLMVALIALLMTPILIGIALPVFYTARTARTEETTANVYLCNLYTDDKQAQYQTAYSELKHAEAAYFSELQQSCSIIGQSLWGQMDDDTFTSTPAGNVPKPPPPAPAAVDASRSTPIAAFKKRVTEFSPAVAAWATVNATVTAVDVAVNTITVNFEMRLDSLILQTAKRTRAAKRSARSLLDVKYPALLDRTGRIKGKDIKLTTDVVSAAGVDGTLTLKTGDRVTSKQMALSVIPTASLYLYPFDEYTATVTLVSSMSVSGDVNCPIALFIKQMNAVVGWKFDARLVPSITDNRNVFDFQDPTDPDSAITLTYEIYLKRTTFVQFFAMFVLIGLWIVSSCSFCYAMDLLYIRPRKVDNFDATLFTTQLFAVVGTRSIMPGVPDVGVGVDFLGIIWIMIICLLIGGMIYARIVAQYVHPDATLYDRLAKNDVWLDDWLKKQEDKETMDKNKREREEERKRRMEKYGEPAGWGKARGNAAAEGKATV